LVIGKNPWQSHGLARARDVINAIRKDPKRSLVVIDPRRSETAARADYHLAVKPGTDAWCLAALVAILVQEQLDDQDWVGRHCVGADEVRAWFRQVDVATCAHHCGIAPDQLYAVARRIAKASSVASIEDLGVQMNHHSTLNSWLHRLIWLLTGNFGIRGGNNTPVPYLGLGEASKGDVGPRRLNPYKTSPVLGSKVIIGLIPCNNIPDEILTDHPNRFRALIVESGNPVHSLADSPRMRAAMRALDFSVVIDVAMTETARQADYVLPAASQYEKTENSFFNLEYPRNSFHLRKRLFPPLEGTLVEAEIHTRLLEALGAMDNAWIRPLSLLARHNRAAFAAAFLLRAARDKAFFAVAANVLYRTLGPTLPDDRPEAAVHWVLSLMYSRKFKRYAANAGFRGLLAGEKLFRAILDSPSGLVFADAGDYHNSFRQIRTPGGKIQLWIPELVDELRSLSAGPPPGNPDFPLILSAGERRDETSNCIIRNPSWDTKGRLGLLRIHPEDARTCQVTEGDRVRLETPARAVEAVVTLTDSLQAGHISLPNGTGLEYPDEQGRCVRHGVAPNELTHTADRDPIAGTPWHKHVPARIEALAD
jgi:anaerobic selenocysteine-containing dehydrogenase